jgi:predicted anti-sigma-YlaC factor YlaD
MKRNPHDEARELIALGERLPETQQASLRAHLHECEACRNYAEAANGVVRSLRSLPLAADSRLVRATQMRVRFHAGRLRETRERMWMVGMACLGVGLSATVTVPFLWRLFAWMGERAGVSTLVWQAGFMFFFVAPALVVSVLLLARGAHLSNAPLANNGNGGESRQWR